MKTYTKYFLFLSLGILITSVIFAQSYCIPPGFKDMGGVGEPFTYISNVELEILNNSTGIPTGIGDDDGYTYYSSLPKPVLQQGQSYQLKVSSKDDLGSGMEVVVWIDWNGDKEFDVSGERVAHWSLQGVHGNSISVPSSAKDGIVRMRVFCDMPTSMGHIPPEPCGYLNYPGHAIGQHGEVEDYDLQIGTPTGIDNHEVKNDIKLYPNPAQNKLTIEQTVSGPAIYKVIDTFGREVKTGQLKATQNLDISELENGQYILMLQGESYSVHRLFHVVR